MHVFSLEEHDIRCKDVVHICFPIFSSCISRCFSTALFDCTVSCRTADVHESLKIASEMTEVVFFFPR